MYYENMPLYPGMRPPCDPSPCMKVRLFDEGCCGSHRPPPMRECERVLIDNPCRRGERAEVVLGMDDCGNLVICVHRLCEREAHRHPEPGRCCPVPMPDSMQDGCMPLPRSRKPHRRHRPDWTCCH